MVKWKTVKMAKPTKRLIESIQTRKRSDKFIGGGYPSDSNTIIVFDDVFESANDRPVNDRPAKREHTTKIILQMIRTHRL